MSLLKIVKNKEGVKMKRPKLKMMDLKKAIEEMLGGGKPCCSITMSTGQWDNLLQISYDHGWILLEVNENEIPVAAYRKE